MTPHDTPTPNFNLCLPTVPSLWKAGWWGTECVSALRTPSFGEINEGEGISSDPTLPGVLLLCPWSFSGEGRGSHPP